MRDCRRPGRLEETFCIDSENFVPFYFTVVTFKLCFYMQSGLLYIKKSKRFSFF